MKNKFVIIDLETTGQSPDNGDRIIEVGIVVVEDDKIVTTYSSLINPEQEISSFISNLTNITNEDVIEAPTFAEKAEEIRRFFKDAYFVAHNVPFDFRFLNEEFNRINLPALRNKTIDTVEISRILFPQAPSYKLSELATYLHIEHDNPHRALDDAIVTAKVFLKLKKKFMKLPYETVTHLLKLERHFQSDIYEILKYQQDQLAFKIEENKDIESFHGIAFRKLPELEDQSINIEEDFGELIEKIYDENGSLAKMITNYEKRTGQREISEIIYDSFINKNHSLIEAGTGIGKTIAYLIPAIYQSLITGERILLSTYTTQLQTQLMEEEIPLLRKIVPFSFSVAMLKGQRHYLSLERFASELREESIENNYDIALTKAMILVWITETETGDIDEIQLSKGGYYFFQHINTKAEGTINPRSPWFKHSYYIHAKRKAQNANLVITNHALLCTDLYNDYELLPSYKYAIIDEAHHFERAAARQGALSVDDIIINYSLNQLGSSSDSKFIGTVLREFPFLDDIFHRKEWDDNFEEVKRTMNELFQAIYTYVKRKRYSDKSFSDIGRIQYSLPERINEQHSWKGILEIANNVISLLNNVVKMLNQLISKREEDKVFFEQTEKDLIHYMTTFNEYIEEMNLFFNVYEPKEEVKWIEIEGDENVYLYQKPIQVGDYLLEHFFNKKDSVILTSATLTMRDSFSFMLNNLGLDKDTVVTKQIDSPYNYEEQVLFMVPKDFPSITKDEEEFIFATCDAISSMAEITKGRMLVLFTSYQMLKRCYYLLQEIIDTNEYMVIAQGITSGSRTRLKKNFQSFPKAILLGTSSFWEGVDIPGEDLSSLMIVRLPFQVPNHPVYEAKAEAIKKENKNAFFTLALPEAVIRFKQGFGRLIRSHTDRGVVFVCDSRIVQSSYSSFFTKSIPNLKVHHDSTANLMKRLEQWF